MTDIGRKFGGCTIEARNLVKGLHSSHTRKVAHWRSNLFHFKVTALNNAVLDFSNIDWGMSFRRSFQAEKVRERRLERCLAPGSEPEGRSRWRPLGGPSLSLHSHSPGLPWPRPSSCNICSVIVCWWVRGWYKCWYCKITRFHRLQIYVKPDCLCWIWLKLTNIQYNANILANYHMVGQINQILG